LILGGWFAYYTAARTLCRLIRQRDDVAVMLISRADFFRYWPMLAGAISSDPHTNNVAQPLRCALIREGASSWRAEVKASTLRSNA